MIRSRRPAWLDEPEVSREAAAEDADREAREWEEHDIWLHDYAAEPTEKGAAA